MTIQYNRKMQGNNYLGTKAGKLTALLLNTTPIQEAQEDQILHASDQLSYEHMSREVLKYKVDG